jgi:hypothetical protein
VLPIGEAANNFAAPAADNEAMPGVRGVAYTVGFSVAVVDGARECRHTSLHQVGRQGLAPLLASVSEEIGADAKITARAIFAAQQFGQVDSSNPASPRLNIKDNVAGAARIFAHLLVEIRCGDLRHFSSCLFGGFARCVVLARALVGCAIVLNSGGKIVGDVHLACSIAAPWRVPMSSYRALRPALQAIIYGQANLFLAMPVCVML